MASRLAVQTLAASKAITQNTTVYTDVCRFDKCAGDATVWVASTAGSVTITQQCSLNYNPNNPTAATWFDPVNSSGSAVGGVQATMTVTTGTYIFYTTVPAPYIRFKVVENNTAATVLDLKFILREEN